jgi:hypothetical protein
MMMSLHQRKSSDIGASPRNGPRPSICKPLSAAVMRTGLHRCRCSTRNQTCAGSQPPMPARCENLSKFYTFFCNITVIIISTRHTLSVALPQLYQTMALKASTVLRRFGA